MTFSVEKQVGDSESSKESSLEDNLTKKVPPQPPPRVKNKQSNESNLNEFAPSPTEDDNYRVSL